MAHINSARLARMVWIVMHENDAQSAQMVQMVMHKNDARCTRNCIVMGADVVRSVHPFKLGVHVEISEVEVITVGKWECQGEMWEGSWLLEVAMSPLIDSC